jgi:hypothetical protein
LADQMIHLAPCNSFVRISDSHVVPNIQLGFYSVPVPDLCVRRRCRSAFMPSP